MMFAKLMKATVLAAALASGAANATVILFSNFDSVIQPAPTRAGSTNRATADGWTGGPRAIELQFNNAAGLAHSGSTLVELDTTANSSMFYNLGAGRYSVSYWYSPRPRIASTSNGITLSIGNTLLDSVTATGGSQTVWQNRIVNFSTQTGGPLTFAAVGTSDRLGGYLDTITISSVVPEPASWAMLVLGFGLIGASARRRQVTSVLA